MGSSASALGSVLALDSVELFSQSWSFLGGGRVASTSVRFLRPMTGLLDARRPATFLAAFFAVFLEAFFFAICASPEQYRGPLLGLGVKR